MFLSCKTTSLFPSDYPGDQLHFGQGGGVTGVVTDFVVLDDGRLYRKGADKSYVYVSTWKRSFTRQMFSNYTTLGLDSVDHYHPGNFYYFIEFHAPDQEPHLISWGQEGYSPPEKVVVFYKVLFKSTT